MYTDDYKSPDTTVESEAEKDKSDGPHEKSNTDPDYHPESPSQKTTKNICQKNLLKNVVSDSDMSTLTPLPLAESTGIDQSQSGSSQKSLNKSQPQSSSSQKSLNKSQNKSGSSQKSLNKSQNKSGSSQNKSQNDSQLAEITSLETKDAIKIIKRFLARKTLPVDWVWKDEEITDLNNKDSKLKSAKPLYVEYDPDRDLIKLDNDSKTSDIKENYVIPMSKETFRELLGRYPDSFRLVKLGKKQMACLKKNWKETDNKFHLPFNYWFLQFIQVHPINDEKTKIRQEKDEFNKTTGNHLI